MSPNPSEVDLERFFVREGGRLRAYLTVLAGDAEANDLVQETFVRAQRARASCAGDMGPWIRRIARNVAIDHHRRSKTTLAIFAEATPDSACANPAEDPGPERLALRREMRGCIAEFVEALPERDAEVILLAELRGLPDKEVAEKLGIGLGAAKIRLHRARTRLRRKLEDGCELSHGEDGLACDRRQ